MLFFKECGLLFHTLKNAILVESNESCFKFRLIFLNLMTLILSELSLNGNVYCSVSYLLITVLFPQGQTELDTKPIQFLINSGLFSSKTTLNTHIKYNISANVMNSTVLVKISFE